MDLHVMSCVHKRINKYILNGQNGNGHVDMALDENQVHEDNEQHHEKPIESATIQSEGIIKEAAHENQQAGGNHEKQSAELDQSSIGCVIM